MTQGYATGMKAQIIDGKALAGRVKETIRTRVQVLREQDRSVRLDAILVDGNSSSGIYAKNQARSCEELGIEYVLHELEADAGHDEVAERVLRLNADEAVSAIMVHMPLPSGMATDEIQSLIAVEKDVEGVNPANIGNVVYGRRSLVPCTALAVIEMIESTGVKLRGSICVCVGASRIVGKPLAVLLMQADATVISTNIHTVDRHQFTRNADVLVCAAGVPGLITPDLVKPGAVVIDVGINRIKGKEGKSMTVGDVAFEEVGEVAGFLSPVPGGVGPMTVAMMMRNTVDAAER